MEKTIRSLVEGAFGKAFGGRVHPAEIAKALLSRMRDTETVSARSSRVANAYVVFLSDSDCRALAPIESSLKAEFVRLLKEAAEAERWTFVGPLSIELQVAPRLSEGQMHIDASFREGIPQGRLRAVGGPCAGREFALRLSRNYIGRGQDNEVQLTDARVSRRHAVIHASGEKFTIEDLSSTNGSFVNHERIERADLREGDLVELGNTLLTFERAV